MDILRIARDFAPTMGEKTARLETQLEIALRDTFNHEGSFAFGETLSSAPNPGLEIDTLGTVGLPPSTRDIESIKGVASRSPFGHGSKTIVDSTVRDTSRNSPKDGEGCNRKP